MIYCHQKYWGIAPNNKLLGFEGSSQVKERAMLFLCRNPSKLQMTEGSLQVTKTDTLLTLSACRFTAKLWSTVKGRSLYVIIYKIVWLYITGITLCDLEMQPLVSTYKQGRRYVVSPDFPELQPIRGSNWRMRTGFIKRIIPFPYPLSQRTP